MRRIERLRDEARELEQRAYDLRLEAQREEEADAYEWAIRAHQKMIRQAAINVMNGKSDLSEAMRLQAQTPRQISYRDALHAIAQELRAVKSLHKIRRNRDIVRLARNHTNAQIAGRMGLSEKHVSRIINAAPLWQRALNWQQGEKS